MTLPQDPFILLSYVNTQLRDNFHSLEAFCACAGVPPVSITEPLSQIGFQYIPEQNQFR